MERINEDEFGQARNAKWAHLSGFELGGFFIKRGGGPGMLCVSYRMTWIEEKYFCECVVWCVFFLLFDSVDRQFRFDVTHINSVEESIY